MELDISGIQRSVQVQEYAKRLKTAEQKDSARKAKNVAKKLVEMAAEAEKSHDAERYLEDILNITQVFNKRLRFSINRELNEVVVKVIDSQTDKVIKEIPPEVLQKLHVRIREAIGLLIDEII